MAAHKIITDAIITAINGPTYVPPLPSLDPATWDKALNWESYHDRNEFFEWMGDSLISAALSVELCRRFPEGNEAIFTVVRQALVSNLTFVHLTHKLGLSERLPFTSNWRTLPRDSKRYADLFELVTAEVFRRDGFEMLCIWVRDVFSPLITPALDQYNSYVVSFKLFYQLSGMT